LLTTIATPIPPYRHVSGQTHTTQTPHTAGRHVCVTCITSRPADLNANNRVTSSNLEQPIQDVGPSGIPSVQCPSPSCINIPTAGPQRPVISEPRRERPLVVYTHIDPAMLVHRVEPVYPTLARQIGRAGRVELRAVIATDGTIQSLQVVSGDPLFYQSALEAVRQWRYRPTVLNGEAVEVDTFITVIYNIDR
jgi:periplasmic protein TonB